jgi:hypothetical protein
MDQVAMTETPQSDPTKGGEAAYIPLGYYSDFLKLLVANPEHFEIITYADLEWGDDFDHLNGYPAEKRAWQNALGSGTRDPSKIYVLLQHDVDTRPERTERVLEIEQELGAPSNVMIFTRRVNRRQLAETNELVFTEYDLEYGFLKRLESEGFVIAYHSNAYEQAHFDDGKAGEILSADIATLRKEFDVKFYSAHGGTPSPNGRNNRDVAFPKSLTGLVRWVHNGASPFFDKSYSDGGINSAARDPSARDLRDFVRLWQPGRRYRVITHPQYYHDPCNVSPRLAEAEWYRDVRRIYNDDGGSAWVGVMPDALQGQCRAGPEVFGVAPGPGLYRHIKRIVDRTEERARAAEAAHAEPVWEARTKAVALAALQRQKESKPAPPALPTQLLLRLRKAVGNVCRTLRG